MVWEDVVLVHELVEIVLRIAAKTILHVPDLVQTVLQSVLPLQTVVLVDVLVDVRAEEALLTAQEDTIVNQRHARVPRQAQQLCTRNLATAAQEQKRKVKMESTGF